MNTAARYSVCLRIWHILCEMSLNMYFQYKILSVLKFYLSAVAYDKYSCHHIVDNFFFFFFTSCSDVPNLFIFHQSYNTTVFLLYVEHMSNFFNV